MSMCRFKFSRNRAGTFQHQSFCTSTSTGSAKWAFLPVPFWIIRALVGLLVPPVVALAEFLAEFHHYRH